MIKVAIAGRVVSENRQLLLKRRTKNRQKLAVP